MDLILSVGISGDFISQMHTLEHLQDHSQPEFMDRRRREKWQAAGAQDSYQLALEKTRTILQNHQPEPLPENILAELRRIIAETEKELV